MPHFLLGVIEPQGQGIPAPEILEPIMANVSSVTSEMKAAGVWVAAGGLEGASSAKTIRTSEGQAIVSDGPFAESKEYLGGFTIVEVEDQAAAVAWGGKLSAATTLPIEVRQFRGPLMT